MDTRNKIITSERAAQLVFDLRARGSRLRVVTGHFDVLLAEHVRRLREAADGCAALFVIVLDPPAPVLAARARAELVAALGVVDYVVLSSLELLRQFRAEEIVQEESADLLRAHRLSEHVQRRHQK